MASAVASVHPRLNDPGYKNWLKVTFGLNVHVKAGLCSFTGNVVQQFQQELLQNLGITDARQCDVVSCDRKNISNCKLNVPCLHGICDKLLLRIVKQHASKTMIDWRNCDIRLWPIKCWEIAKVYMGRGQPASNTGPERTDCAGLLQLMSKCLQFRKPPNSVPPKDIDSMLQIRNKSMHSVDMEVSGEEASRNIDQMIRFLQLIQIFDNNDLVHQAIDGLTELKSLNLEIGFEESTLHNMEMTCLEQKITDLDSRLNNNNSNDNSGEQNAENDTEMRTEAMQLVVFLERNPDLARCVELSERLQEVLSTFHLILTNTQRTEDRVDVTERRIETLTQDQLAMVCRIELLENNLATGNSTGANTNVTNYNYRGLLQNYLQGRGLPLPDYQSTPAVSTTTGVNGFKCKVTVNGRVFTSDEVFIRKSDAHQNVAKLAFEQLQPSASSAQSSPVNGASPGNANNAVIAVGDRLNTSLTISAPPAYLPSASADTSVNIIRTSPTVSTLTFSNTMEAPYTSLLTVICRYKGYGEPTVTSSAVKVSVPFSSDGCKASKKEAEESAAQCAMSVLEPVVVVAAAAPAPAASRNARARLKEFCDRQLGCKLAIYTSSAPPAPFSCTVLVEVVQPITSDADAAARSLLAKLQLIPNILRLHVADRFQQFVCSCSQSVAEAGTFVAQLTATCTFSPSTRHKTKKDAEKHAAKFAASLLYPDAGVSNLDRFKNLLQERYKKGKLVYEPVPRDDGLFYCSVSVPFELRECSHDLIDSADIVAKTALERTGHLA